MLKAMQKVLARRSLENRQGPAAGEAKPDNASETAGGPAPSSIFLPSDPSPSQHLVGWIYEDELPKSYPYDEMFPHSKVDGVRMFPVFAPAPQEQVPGSDPTEAQLEAAMNVSVISPRRAYLRKVLAAALTTEGQP